ncbi:MAG: hypothetical protein HXY50_06215 [Ignavibacteriaceae bacterium]|nr:hypothetical protein [Ignavibacteriaceae bacterium]
MSYRDQSKYLDFLRKFERKFERKEAEDFKMLMKMQKDEEEFDSISMSKLKALYDKYNIPVDRSKYDAFFKKKET